MSASEPKFPPPCFAFLKSELLESDPSGRAVVRFRPIEAMENPFGTIQGGVLAGVIDNVIGPALFAFAPDRVNTTVQLSVNFLGAVRAGEVLIGRAEVVKAGRSQAYVEARLERESDGKLLVKASATHLFLDR